MTHNKFCIPLEPNKQPSKTLLVGKLLYTLVSMDNENACYQLVVGRRKKKRRPFVCSTICIIGDGRFVPTTPCSGIREALADGNNGSPYLNTLTSTGGTSPYTYTISAGTLPTGLSLVADAISGTPTVDDTFNFTVTSTDANGCTGSQDFSITVFSI